PDLLDDDRLLADVARAAEARVAPQCGQSLRAEGGEELLVEHLVLVELEHPLLRRDVPDQRADGLPQLAQAAALGERVGREAGRVGQVTHVSSSPSVQTRRGRDGARRSTPPWPRGPVPAAGGGTGREDAARCRVRRRASRGPRAGAAGPTPGAAA